ncbi:MAG: TetR/AcrR family transcriptional regulator [Candidatus Binatia bacterium]
MAANADSARGGERLQRRRERTARALLDAARHVLAANGFHATKIVDIARAARVGVGTFYLYYPTKEACFVELVEDSVARLRAELDRGRDAVDDPIEQSRARIRTFFRFAQENREVFRIVFWHGASFHHVVRRCQEGFITDLRDRIASGMAASAFRRGDALIWAEAVIGMCQQVLSWWIEQDVVSVEDLAESLSDLVLHGIIAPARADARD